MTALAPRPRTTDASADALVDAALDGDEFAWQVLCDRHIGQVRSVAHARLRDEHAAEDVVQETLLRAWMRLHQLDDPSRLAAWLKTIAARVAVDHLRARREHAPLEVVGDRHVGSAEPLVDHVVEREAAAVLHGHLAELRERDRSALWQRDALGVSVGELADQFEMTTGSVRVLLTRARSRVRDSYGALTAPLLGLAARFRQRFAGLGESTTAAVLTPAVVVAVAAGVTVGVGQGPAVDVSPPAPVVQPAPAAASTSVREAPVSVLPAVVEQSPTTGAAASRTSPPATPAPAEPADDDAGRSVIGPHNGFQEGAPDDEEEDVRSPDVPVGPVEGADVYLEDTVGSLDDSCTLCG